MDHYRRLLSRNPIDLYVVGDLDPEQVMAVAGESLASSGSRPGKRFRRLSSTANHRK